MVDEEAPGLVICGKQAIDNDMNQTGQMLRRCWAGRRAPSPRGRARRRHGTVTREVDGGLQTDQGPAARVVTVDLRLNEPRYASLPNIMKAKKKPLERRRAADYGVDVSPRLDDR